MKKFTKTEESFVCENCGTIVEGNGYTNHCPSCLFSKHVDVNPGDRQCGCKGLMEPVDVLQKNGEYVILHKCLRCGFERKNKFSESDSFNSLLEIIRKLNRNR